MSASLLAQAGMGGAQDVAAVLTEPDDDWEAVLLIRSKDGSVAAFPVDTFFATDEMRQRFAEQVLPRLIEDNDLEEIVIVASMWVGEPEDENGVPRTSSPRYDEDRNEAVVVTAITKDGIVRHLARITRSEDGPPTLGDWEANPSILEWGGLGAVSYNALEALKARA